MFYLNPGQTANVQESVSVFTYDLGFASAYADPYFAIDAVLLNDNPGLTLQFSPFVGNDPAASAVTEPATWAMTIVGFGLAGGGLRRRRTPSAVRFAHAC